MTMQAGETADLLRVTLSFDLPRNTVEASDDFKGATQGITVESVAAWMCRKHDPKHGYIHFTVAASGRQLQEGER